MISSHWGAAKKKLPPKALLNAAANKLMHAQGRQFSHSGVNDLSEGYDWRWPSMQWEDDVHTKSTKFYLPTRRPGLHWVRSFNDNRQLDLNLQNSDIPEMPLMNWRRLKITTRREPMRDYPPAEKHLLLLAANEFFSFKFDKHLVNDAGLWQWWSKWLLFCCCAFSSLVYCYVTGMCPMQRRQMTLRRSTRTRFKRFPEQKSTQL